jgi:hypothetical protein
MTADPELNLRGGLTVRVGMIASAMLVSRVSRVRSPTLRLVTANDIIEKIEEHSRGATDRMTMTMPRHRDDPEAGSCPVDLRIRTSFKDESLRVLCASLEPVPGLTIYERRTQATVHLNYDSFPSSTMNSMRERCRKDELTLGSIVETGLPQLDSARLSIPQSYANTADLVMLMDARSLTFATFAKRLAKACRA